MAKNACKGQSWKQKWNTRNTVRMRSWKAWVNKKDHLTIDQESENLEVYVQVCHKQKVNGTKTRERFQNKTESGEKETPMAAVRSVQQRRKTLNCQSGDSPDTHCRAAPKGVSQSVSSLHLPLHHILIVPQTQLVSQTNSVGLPHMNTHTHQPYNTTLMCWLGTWRHTWHDKTIRQ